MGIIDSTVHTVTCNCGNAEKATINQHGSAYGGTWQSGKNMQTFKLTWGPSGLIGPEIKEAICLKCGAKANVEVS